MHLRQTQWLLDEFAFDADTNRLKAHQIAEATAVLIWLTALLSSIDSPGGPAAWDVSAETVPDAISEWRK